MTLLRIHAGLDELEGDFATDRLGLLSNEDCAHAAFADLLEELLSAPGDHGSHRRCLQFVTGGDAAIPVQ